MHPPHYAGQKKPQPAPKSGLRGRVVPPKKYRMPAKGAKQC